MTVYADTSALYAVLDASDRFHVPAAAAWKKLIHAETSLVCSNYVQLECLALTQSRLGLDGVRCLVDEMLPVVAIEWVDRQEHEAAVGTLVAADRRRVSLVDYTSFALMRRMGLRRAFSFDPHFAEQGFEVLPAAG